MKKMICVMLILALTLCGCSLGKGEETSLPNESSAVQTTPERSGSQVQSADTTGESALPEEPSQPEETADFTVSPSEGSNLLTTEEAPGKIEGEPPEGDYQIPPQPTTEISDS